MTDANPFPASEGLARDLIEIERLRIGRRSAMSMFGVGGVALLGGCGGGGSGSATPLATATPTPTPTATATATPTPTPTATATGGACTLYATETNGPYPADGTNTANGPTSNVLSASGVMRSDIRSSFVNGSTATAPGIPLTLNIRLVDVNNACAALAGYAIYIWHCNATGQYSLYDVPAESWLRGLQVADANGSVTFTTIWPGCYAGRFPHIHLEVFSSQANATRGSFARLISQFAMPDAQNQLAYADSRYGNSASNYANVSISRDNVFGDNSSAQMSAMTPSVTGSVSAGLSASAVVGLTT